MFGADKGTPNLLDGKKLSIGIVQAPFNEGVTDALFAACHAELIQLGVLEKHILHVKVPGALEVPVALQALAERDDFDALIALGCIIRGETYHFELVANESGAGVTRVGMDYHVPIANAILTTENLEQAVARQTDKGRDAARVAVEMACIMDDLSADELADAFAEAVEIIKMAVAEDPSSEYYKEQLARFEELLAQQTAKP